MTNVAPPKIPRVGMLATVRNRRGVVSAVEPFDGDSGRLHLVHIEYNDDRLPRDDQLLWELESRADLVEPHALPEINEPPMRADDFDALLRAARWGATFPYLDPDGSGPVGRRPISSPFHGAFQVEDYQLVPLLKALQMPRVNLLIADDVGLGKTIEAGMILSELLLRRRIQRVLILTPASLRLQWKDEMWEKFSLGFDLDDRRQTEKMKRRLGMDANPWRAHSRIIASYHYLRQPDVLDQFMSASQTPDGSPHLPWDLLIVDECHNLMPSAFGDDSDLCKMLRILAPQFEHRLFLSATPHNGHTRCFTGLLEILDPVRFSQVSELRPAERSRVGQIVLRRLKREINARTNPPKFCHRAPPKALVLDMDADEEALSAAFSELRQAVRQLTTEGDGGRRAGNFAVEVLGKRLLSCPTAFAESWRRSKDGLVRDEAATDGDVAAAERTVREETGDDREAQQREDTAAHVVGSWLQNIAPDLKPEIAAVDAAVKAIGFDLDGADIVDQTPSRDSRLRILLNLIDELLLKGSVWRDDERLVIFTEYKTTLDYLARCLRVQYDETRLLTLFGGMDDVTRDQVKAAFNDPEHTVRILLATDAAAEGLNLQKTARYLLHYDCPWNPSRLEQRNGRLDRHGQARDVTTHHFVSNQDHDLQFLSHVIAKADEIREDLGATNELFDEAAHRKLVAGESLENVRRDLDARVATARGRAVIEADNTFGTDEASGGMPRDLAAIADEVDLDPQTLRDTLEAAMAIRTGRPQLDCAEATGTCQIINPDLNNWSDVIDESLRRGSTSGARGPVARIAFNADPFITDIGGRNIFSSRPDVLMMHLSHPMLQKALSALSRCRFPGSGDNASRWSVRLNSIPKDTEAVILLSFEELAVNDLRESFHHWVQTLCFPVKAGRLCPPLPHVAAKELRGAVATHDPAHYEQAQDVLIDVEQDLKDHIKAHTERLTITLREQLERDGSAARQQEDERYRSRQGEVSSLIADNTLAKLEREVEELKMSKAQGELFAEAERLERIDRSIAEKQDEQARRTRHFEEVRLQLEKERTRILNHLLPKRHALTSHAQVFPVTLEVWLPGGAA